jgi:hypothetical protein
VTLRRGPRRGFWDTDLEIWRSTGSGPDRDLRVSDESRPRQAGYWGYRNSGDVEVKGDAREMAVSLIHLGMVE